MTRRKIRTEKMSDPARRLAVGLLGPIRQEIHQRQLQRFELRPRPRRERGFLWSRCRAAELNGYPGPIHVLELADKLELTATQRAQIEALFAAMKAEAVPLGERLIAQEADLDRQFASRTITPATLAAGTEAIGMTQAALRNAHLKYHLATVAILMPGQVERYASLRGYVAADHHPGHH